MISPLGRGHRGGTLSITSSRGSGSRGSSGARRRALGPAPAAAAKGPAANEPVAVGSAEAGEGPAAGEVGPRCTYGLKE